MVTSMQWIDTYNGGMFSLREGVINKDTMTFQSKNAVASMSS